MQKFNELKSPALAKEFCVKNNYVAYINLYPSPNKKASVKTKLMYKKRYKTLMFYKNLSAKIHRNNG